MRRSERSWGRIRVRLSRGTMRLIATPTCALMLAAGGAGVTMADEMPAHSDGSIDATADYCSFRGDTAASYVEVYIQVMLGGLTFKEGAGGAVESGLSFRAFLTDDEGTRFKVREWERNVRFDSPEASKKAGLSLYDVLDTALKPGRYTLELMISEREGEGRAALQLPLLIQSYADSSLIISDIQVARSAERAGEAGDLFCKNGYRMIPNPSRRYGEALPIVYTYAEVYGLQPMAGDTVGLFRGLYEVVNMTGATVYSKGPFLVQKAGNTAVLVGQFDVAELDPGFYRLRMSVFDSGDSAMTAGAEATKLFFRPEEDLGVPGVTGLSRAESTAAEMELRYVAKPSEIRQFRELNPVGQAGFLERFWATRDPDPDTPENEARLELHRRVAYAQQSFGALKRLGMDTDRGRVYIKYGPPAEISALSGSRTCKDHEIWIYYEERERQFVFFDEFGTGEYRLIHSTYPGEVERVDWEEIVCEPDYFNPFASP